MERDEEEPEGYLTFVRDARLFVHDRSLAERLGADLQSVPLAPDEIYRPPLPADLAVRLGKLRVSEFLTDGREVTRAVLQAGAVLRTRTSPAAPACERPDPEGMGESGNRADPGQDRIDPAAYPLNRVLLMALGEGELWVFPAGMLPAQES